ncbi:efflux RND transporter permease subunit [bacterium]|nr:efflux RND transporter permease subunit [bacterium]
MKLIDHAVRRPVAVAMGGLIVLFTGIYAVRRLPLELTPDTNFPKLTVTANWHDTSSEVMEAYITAPIETAAASLPGVKELTSESSEGISRVTLEFQRGTDMEFAALALSEALHSLRKNLPPGAGKPQIEKYVPREFQKGQFYSLRMSGPLGLASLRSIALKNIMPALLGVDGVADVRVLGGQDRELAIRLDEAALRAHGIDENHVQSALGALAFRKAVGAIHQHNERHILFIDMPLDSITAIENTILSTNNGVPIRLADVSEVTDAHGRPYHLSRIDGNPAISIQIEKETGKNTIAVVDAITEKMEQLRYRLPAGIEFQVLNDQSREIRRELSALSHRAIYSVAVIFLVLMAFLSTLRAPFIILSTIFFSVLLAFNGFLLVGMSLNLLTLAGLALGFGMLVDNAIVVVENITKHRQAGLPIHEAAIHGAREVVMPIIAATMTTIAAFIPFLYLTGELRLFYLPFTLAVGFSLIASLVVAFIITPSLTARLYTHSNKAPKSSWTDKLRKVYGGFLRRILHHRGLTLFATIIIVAGSVWIFEKKVTKGEIWRYGNSSKEVLSVYLRMPKGARLTRTDEIISRFEKKAVGQGGVKRVLVNVSDERAQMRIEFTDAGLNSPAPYLLKESCIAEAAYIAGFGISVSGFGDPFHSGGGGGQYLSNRLEILGYNYQEVKNIAHKLARRLRRHPRVKDINTDAATYWGGSNQEVVLRIKRQELSRYKVTPAWILYRIQSHLKENLGHNSLILNNERVPYALRFKTADAFSVEDLENMLIRLPAGEQALRLSQVVSFEKRRVMGTILRKNQQYQRTIAWDFRGPPKLAHKLTDRILETTHLPPGYKIQQRKWRITEEDKKQIGLILSLSILLVFMVTAGLFESFLHPFVILLTVPLALSGVFIIFWLTDTNFNQSAYIGVVLLGGIVVNDSILLVDHINQRRRDGESILEAVIHGAVDRVRPILMTTLTTIGGLLPLVIMEQGTDDIWYTLALATIGGLIASTILVLTVIPALYVSLEKWHWRWRNN